MIWFCGLVTLAYLTIFEGCNVGSHGITFGIPAQDIWCLKYVPEWHIDQVNKATWLLQLWLPSLNTCQSATIQPFIWNHTLTRWNVKGKQYSTLPLGYISVNQIILTYHIRYTQESRQAHCRHFNTSSWTNYEDPLNLLTGLYRQHPGLFSHVTPWLLLLNVFVTALIKSVIGRLKNVFCWTQTRSNYKGAVGLYVWCALDTGDNPLGQWSLIQITRHDNSAHLPGVTSASTWSHAMQTRDQFASQPVLLHAQKSLN